MRFVVVAVYSDQSTELLIGAESLSEGCSLALRIADEFGSVAEAGRPKWIRLMEEDQLLIEIRVFEGGLDPNTKI